MTHSSPTLSSYFTSTPVDPSQRSLPLRLGHVHSDLSVPGSEGGSAARSSFGTGTGVGDSVAFGGSVTFGDSVTFGGSVGFGDSVIFRAAVLWVPFAISSLRRGVVGTFGMFSGPWIASRFLWEVIGVPGMLSSVTGIGDVDGDAWNSGLGAQLPSISILRVTNEFPSMHI